MPGWLDWGAASEDRDTILKQLGIRHFDEDILTQSIEWLRTHFGYPTTPNIRLVPFFRNVIWQLYEYIQAGKPPDFVKKHGFIRGMWYHIKSRITRYKQLRGHYYGTMNTALTVMVRAGLFSYKDFNFRDRDQEQRQLGTDNTHIIVFSEKDGFISIMEEIAATYGCTVITLGGIPSFLSSNYMVSEMVEAKWPMDQEFFCFSIVDFDPSGYNAAEEFIKQLRDSGLRNFHQFEQYKDGKSYPWLDLVQPKNLTGQDIDLVKYALPVGVQRAPSTLEWAKRTGGVDGKGSRMWGLESDEFTEERIHELVDQAITPYLRTSRAVVQRRAAMRKLEKVLTDFMVYKMLHPPPVGAGRGGVSQKGKL